MERVCFKYIVDKNKNKRDNINKFSFYTHLSTLIKDFVFFLKIVNPINTFKGKIKFI